MKLKVFLIALVLGLTSIFSQFSMVGATTDTEQVVPTVRVASTGSLSISGKSNVQWGTSENPLPTGSTQTGTVSLSVTADASWKLTVKKNQDLRDANINETIPSTNFTFTSGAGTPAPPGTPTYVTSDKKFYISAAEATGDSSNLNVVTDGSATSSSNVEVTYTLNIPAGQPRGYYTATHTYTLIVE